VTEATDVSVLTPSYGYGRFIADSIESVIRQDGLHIEHIIQDGGSKDETLDVLRSFGDQIVWTSEPDQGQSDALNRALTKATGRWVAWLNADEFYLPGGLARLIHEAERSGADVVYGDAIEVDRDGKMLELRPAHPFVPLILRSYGAFPNTTSVVVRRESLGADPWDPTLKVVMDWDLYLGLLQKGSTFRYVPYPVGAYRHHEDQMSAGPGRGQVAGVRERYGIRTGPIYRVTGLTIHRIYKLVARSYLRQLRARSLHGVDLRWFKDGLGNGHFQALLERCYGSREKRPDR
jgi:glycosyltransferase involved in cell wall biosynthesis